MPLPRTRPTDPDLGGIGRAVGWMRPDVEPAPPPPVRAAREAAGWTQRELAARLRCGRTMVQRIEGGSRRVGARMARRLTEVFGPGWDGAQ